MARVKDFPGDTLSKGEEHIPGKRRGMGKPMITGSVQILLGDAMVRRAVEDKTGGGLLGAGIVVVEPTDLDGALKQLFPAKRDYLLKIHGNPLFQWLNQVLVNGGPDLHRRAQTRDDPRPEVAVNINQMTLLDERENLVALGRTPPANIIPADDRLEIAGRDLTLVREMDFHERDQPGRITANKIFGNGSRAAGYSSAGGHIKKVGVEKSGRVGVGANERPHQGGLEFAAGLVAEENFQAVPE